MGKITERVAKMDDATLDRIQAAYVKYIRLNGRLHNPVLTEEYDAIVAEIERRRTN